MQITRGQGDHDMSGREQYAIACTAGTRVWSTPAMLAPRKREHGSRTPQSRTPNGQPLSGDTLSNALMQVSNRHTKDDMPLASF